MLSGNAKRKAKILDTQTNNTPEAEINLHQRPRFMKPMGKILLGACAALLSSGLGLALPVVGMLTMLAVFLAVMVGLIVYGYADALGLGVYLLVYEVCQLVLGGPLLSAAMLLAVSLPLVCMALMDLKKLSFFKRLYASLAVELLGMLLALGLIVLIYRQNLGDLMTRALMSSFEGLSQSVKDLLATYYKQLYAAMGLQLKYETGDELLKAVSEISGEYVKTGLPAMLIVLASVNVLPGVKICSNIRVGRFIPGAASEPATNWRMGDQAIIGLILLTVTGIVLNATMGPRGQVVLYTVLTLLVVACAVQTVASLSDRLSRVPMGRGTKIAFILIPMLLFAQIIPYYGVMSMLFGSHGLISGFIKRRRDNRPDDGGPFDEPF